MFDFRDVYGAVYVLENAKARRVKVGTTGNNVGVRLRDVNRMWLSRKVVCQICGARRLASEDGLMPLHVVSGADCPGGGEWPLEENTLIAERYREQLRKALQELSGSEKSSAARKLKKLEERIEMYRDYDQPVGTWQLSTIFYTKCAGHVEVLSHQILAAHLDRQAPFGEVFCCSVPDASAAVESALSRLGLLESARIEVRDDTTSEKYGQCVMCGNSLTKKGSCPDCAQQFSRL